jgi:hypothetical protein
MSEGRAEAALRRQSQLEGVRGTWESHWSEVAERALPRQRDFKVKRTGGEKLTENVFDSTAPLALERFAAAMESMLTPRTQRWHELKPPEHLQNSEAVKRYLFEVTSTLFRIRYAPTANFASQMHETYMGLGAFGTGAVFVDEILGLGLRYISVPLAELFIAENYQGQIDTVHRRFEKSARAIVKRFGEDNVPAAIKKAAEREPDRCFELLHCFKPREDADWSRMDYQGMPWASYYISYEGRTLLSEGGFHTQRYAVSRYVTAPKEVYGRSPAMTVLADIKSANEMQKTLLRTGQKIADPPMLLSEDGSLTAFNLTPGAYNYGALGPLGEELAKPLQVGKDMPITLEMQQETRKGINDAFLVTLFQILVQSPEMTATEAMLRAQEKGALLAPTMGRQQSEMLGPLVLAELDILARARQLPPMPEELVGEESHYELAYTSPLTRAQQADEGVGILRTIEQAGVLVQSDPTAALIFQGKGSEIIRTLADINGMPSKLLNTPDEVEQLKAQAAQAAQLQAMLAAAPAAAGAAKDLAQAQSLAASSPNRPAPALLSAGAA